ncbi:hypothetical protein J6590_013881 [Homalodisca vitripennis]|nr:hypothetical protein J6590_013881 [Homalodisca vitripennis]
MFPCLVPVLIGGSTFFLFKPVVITSLIDCLPLPFQGFAGMPPRLLAQRPRTDWVAVIRSLLQLDVGLQLTTELTLNADCLCARQFQIRFASLFTISAHTSAPYRRTDWVAVIRSLLQLDVGLQLTSWIRFLVHHICSHLSSVQENGLGCSYQKSSTAGRQPTIDPYPELLGGLSGPDRHPTQAERYDSFHPLLCEEHNHCLG